MRCTDILLGLMGALLASASRADVLYTVEEGGDVLCQLDTATGVITPIGPLGANFAFGDLAFDSSQGVMYMTDGWGSGLSVSSSLYRVNLSTGAATFVGTMGATSVFGLVYDPLANKLYGAASTTSTAFYEIDRSTGVATLIGDPGVGLDGLTYVGGANQVIGLFAGPGSLHSLDVATGASAVLSPGGGFVNNCGIAWSASSNTVYSIDWSGDVYAFDVAAGYARTTLFSGLGAFDGLAAAGSSCPAPTVYCTAGTTTHGCNASISASGPLSVASASGCVIDVTSVEGQRSGLILYSTMGAAAFPWGLGSTSWFCVVGPVQRTQQQLSGGTSGQCDGALSLDLRAFLAANPGAAGNPLTVGATFRAQGWFRDPLAPRSTNLSDAVAIPTCP